MLALVYRGPGRLELEERPEPEPADGDMLVQVDACSICGTDLRIAAGGHRAYTNGAGRTPGHELVGTVLEPGRRADVATGQKVFVAPNYGCRQCRRGRVNLCQCVRAIGITDNGGFAQRVLVPAPLVEQGNLIPLPAGADPAVYALAEPLACALRGVVATGITDGDRVLIFGAGPVGLFHVALARAAGAGTVIVSDPHPDRRSVALAWGATTVAGTDPDEVRDVVGSACTQTGVDVVMVAAPAPSAHVLALEMAGSGGRVNFFAGLPRDRSRVELDTGLVHYKELLVTGTTGSTNEACRAAIELIAKGNIDAGSLISARLPLASAADAFALAGPGRAMKVVVQP